jgi:hypothetical protein
MKYYDGKLFLTDFLDYGRTKARKERHKYAIESFKCSIIKSSNTDFSSWHNNMIMFPPITNNRNSVIGITMKQVPVGYFFMNHSFAYMCFFSQQMTKIRKHKTVL